VNGRCEETERAGGFEDRMVAQAPREVIVTDRSVAVDDEIVMSVVIPCMNEEMVVGDAVRSAREGLALAGVEGEVIVVDSSSDRSAQIAESAGARVVKVPPRGLGQAYLDAIPLLRGKYVIMGDADGTYDFRQIGRFLSKLDAGFEYVMGTRMGGTVEKGAMPWLHRYFGIPVTTKLLNWLIGTKFSDIHCGLRALTYDALKRMDLQSRSWEYASEMVVKAGLLRLKCAEVPIDFRKDQEGRQSHLKRNGWLAPWHAGWLNLRIILLYAPNFVFLVPAAVFLIVGVLLVGALWTGPIKIGGLGLDVHAMLLGVTLIIVGYMWLHMGLAAKAFLNLKEYYQDRFTRWLARRFTYDIGIVTGAILAVAGLSLELAFAVRWTLLGFYLRDVSRLGVLGLLLIVLGLQTIFFTFIVEIAKLSHRASGQP
jgi:glycosyltransferase involved in cell wall biosynthesis